MIHYVTGDATRPIGYGQKIIAHVCNDAGGWGAGFVLAVSKRWAAPEREYRVRAAKGGALQMGTIDLIRVEPTICVANMIAQLGFGYRNGEIPLRYSALKECLEKLAIEARELHATVHMPRIGCGLAGGTWGRVEPIIEAALTAHEVFVYDLPVSS